MAEPTYTLYVRVPIQRRDFVDPPPVNWDTSKDDDLWKILSGAAQQEIDWNMVADRFDVTVDFLLKQVAYLTERHASQVRAQVRKATAAAKGSAAPSPIPGSESAAGGNLRTASALSIRRDSPMPRNDGSTTATSLNTSARPNISRNTSANTAVLRDAGESSPKPGTRQLAIRPTEQVGRTRLSMMPVASPTTKSPDPRVAADLDRITSPGPTELSSATSSDDESSPAQSRIIRRPPRFQQQQEAYTAYQGDDDDESEPAFQPYRPNSNQTSAQDLSSTLRGDGRNTHKRGKQTASKDPIHYSHTSDSSAGSPAIIRRPSKSRDNRGTGPLSPRRTTEVRSPGGKSTKSGSRDGSDGTPSMGSSFSDLDDASVTQSALEEALASHMNRGGGSRFSISQAFRSRYNPGSN